ncbi:actin-like ATPase domain-containing protein [Piromyces finnis]|uniref:Actin-like ATPase domain-containing protein n=1 Tax=Piromyces finnis TaxID=1754191 RepID=A0A1Y1V034_9FUNG|nr:actin-like ATPase domain-containing protein [Piromyces finnis]|eukprot:ORX43767.1 actin-like ATPase domain-containing protein [Piromyces finnis]
MDENNNNTINIISEVTNKEISETKVDENTSSSNNFLSNNKVKTENNKENINTKSNSINENVKNINEKSDNNNVTTKKEKGIFKNEKLENPLENESTKTEVNCNSQNENEITTEKINISGIEISKQNENSNINNKKISDSNIFDSNKQKSEVKEKKETKKRISKNHTNLKKTSVSIIQPLIIRKGASSNFLKGNSSYLNEGNNVLLDPEKNYSDVIVIHPGSRYLRIGKASDAFPTQIPHCIARDVSPLKTPILNKTSTNDNKENINKESINENESMEGIENSTKDSEDEEHANKRRKGNNSKRINIESDNENNIQRRSLRNKIKNKNNDDDEDTYIYSDELIINKEYIKKLETDIKFRMRLAKMRVTPNAHSQVQQYNIQSIPEVIPDHNDPYKIEWTTTENHEKYFVGLKALRLKSYVKKDEEIKKDSDSQYRLLFPIKYGSFNLEDYDNLRVVLGDIERIWTYAIVNELNVKRSEFKNYNVVLVIPDIYDKVYVVELINLLLKEMNFRAIIVQQESACAAFGAGFSMSCIVDIGAQKTSISCIEDGFCIPETRLNLKYGGDDITKLLMALLMHNSFPYSEIDLTRIYDWQLAQELKERFCTVIESDLTCRVYTFYVRLPDRDTRVFSLKVYDEVVMASMLLFNTHMIDFKKKFHYLIDSKNNYMNEVSVEEIVRLNDHMKSQNQSNTNSNNQTNNIDVDANTISECPTPNTSSTVNIKEKVKVETSINKPNKLNSMDVDSESIEESKNHDGTDNRNTILINDSSENDIFERISQPLDVAIAKSITTYVKTISEGWEFTGTNSRKEKDIEDRIRKIYSSILVIGGGGMIPGLSKMIEDRVSHWLHVLLPQGILNSAIQHEIKDDISVVDDKRRTVNRKGNTKTAPQRKGLGGSSNTTGTGTAIIAPKVITSPRDIDSRVLTWKGASILSKLDCASEMWVGAKEWENGGIKGCYKWLFLWE